jgi:hypothetical protein
MAYTTGAFKTTDAVGNREDLTDIIYNISPTETPFMSMIAGKGKAKNTYHEWQIDTLASAAINSVVEGNDAVHTTAGATTRVGNRTQISEKLVAVTGTQEAVDKAGRSSEYRYQLAKRGAEIKRDMEFGLTGNYASSAGTSAVPRRLGSLEAWFTTNTQRDTGSVPADGGFSGGDVAAATDGTAGGLRTITEAMLKTAMQQAWTAGGKPEYALCGPVNKVKISAFAGIATLYRDTGSQMKQASIMGAADVYVSDFGQVKIVPSRFCRERTVTVLDPNYWEIGYLRPFKQEELAKTGDAKKGMLNVEYTLVSKNEAASAVIADLLTS